MREKLIELIREIDGKVIVYAYMTWDEQKESMYSQLAEHLIANGVTFAEDNNVPSKWISVKDRLPEQYESVIVWTSDKELGEAEHDGKHFRWAYDDDYANVTHWMPLPQPPKGE